MNLTLSQLGPYRVEKTEEYDFAEISGKSYCEMIRVRGSISDPPGFTTPSHLYKYSETHVGLYLKDKKNLWRPLGKLLDKKIDISDQEMDFIFPVELFSEVAKIVPFIRKRGLSGNSELAIEIGRATQFKKNERHKVEQTEPNSHSTMPHGVITRDGFEDVKTDNETAITLDTFKGDA